VELIINLHGSMQPGCYNPKDFLDILIKGNVKFYDDLSLSHVSNIIKDVIIYGKDDNEAHEIKKRYIKPIIDDRMFVCCIVCDSYFSKKLKAFNNKSGEYLFLTDCNEKELDDNLTTIRQTMSSKLYKLLFVDVTANDASCQSRVMRRKILENSIYDRWIEYGTVYGVSHHAFVSVTGDPLKILSITATVINPFLTQYVELVKIALIQRATILAFSKHASDLASGLNGDGTASEGTLTKIRALGERYAKAHNQVFLFEVTTQEQGVELFDMIEKQLYIERNKGFLDVQLKNLYDVADSIGEKMERDEEKKHSAMLEEENAQAQKHTEMLEKENAEAQKLNNILAAFAIPSIILAILQVIFPMISDASGNWILRSLLILITIVIIIAWVMILHSILKHELSTFLSKYRITAAMLREEIRIFVKWIQIGMKSQKIGKTGKMEGR